MMATQKDVDDIVARIKKLVEKHGGQSDALAPVRKFYKMFRDCPEVGSYTFLKMEVEKLEAQP